MYKIYFVFCFLFFFSLLQEANATERRPVDIALGLCVDLGRDEAGSGHVGDGDDADEVLPLLDAGPSTHTVLLSQASHEHAATGGEREGVDETNLLDLADLDERAPADRGELPQTDKAIRGP